MNKLWLFVIMSLILGTFVEAADFYNHSTYDMNTGINISKYKDAFDTLNSHMYFFSNKPNPIKYEDIILSMKSLKFINPFSEVRFTKLKDSCNKLPANPAKVGPSTACGKIILDVNGFNLGVNKLFQDKKSLQARDQFVLYLYSDAVKPAYMSPEDLLLISNPKL